VSSGWVLNAGVVVVSLAAAAAVVLGLVVVVNSVHEIALERKNRPRPLEYPSCHASAPRRTGVALPPDHAFGNLGTFLGGGYSVSMSWPDGYQQVMVCWLFGNGFVDPETEAITKRKSVPSSVPDEWLRGLAATSAWEEVCFHEPGFHSASLSPVVPEWDEARAALCKRLGLKRLKLSLMADTIKAYAERLNADCGRSRED